MGCCKSFFLSLLFVGFLGYALLKNEGSYSCQGDWGSSMALRSRTGFGVCRWEVKLRAAWSKKPFLYWATSYEGDWHEGKMEGQGVYKSFSGCTYTGQWVSSARQGVGTFTLPDGSTLTGNWVQDALSCELAVLTMSGKAKYADTSATLSRPSVWQGPVQAARPTGQGKLLLNDSSVQVTGTWAGGQLWGPATATIIGQDGHSETFDFDADGMSFTLGKGHLVWHHKEGWQGTAGKGTLVQADIFRAVYYHQAYFLAAAIPANDHPFGFDDKSKDEEDQQEHPAMKQLREQEGPGPELPEKLPWDEILSPEEQREARGGKQEEL